MRVRALFLSTSIALALASVPSFLLAQTHQCFRHDPARGWRSCSGDDAYDSYRIADRIRNVDRIRDNAERIAERVERTAERVRDRSYDNALRDQQRMADRAARVADRMRESRLRALDRQAIRIRVRRLDW